MSTAPQTPGRLASDAMDDDSVVDHVADARHRARDMLSGESHLGDVDDWRQACVTARDAVVLLWLFWVALRGFGVVHPPGPLLTAAGLGVSLYLGVAAAIAARVRLRYLENELARERREINENPQHEREEVRALYAAKGFREPLLSQVVDVICADDDRLLKVMMEEELGLFVQHAHHPLLVGVWNMIGAVCGTLLLAAPLCARNLGGLGYWVPAMTTIMIVWIGLVTARVTGRALVPMLTVWLFTAAVSGGVTYWTAQWLAGTP
ncbi:MAG: hypothetical protein HOP29_04775 [Phycisphaerales bacterium]|nr:hypothetical protein [Phycisphaerales bacterium]